MKALTFGDSALRWLLCKTTGLVTPRVYWSWLSNLRLREIPEPVLPNGQWVKLRTLLGGICGTDLGIIFQRNHPGSMLRAFAGCPMGLGHENVAIIDQVGDQVPGWSAGMRVVVEPSLSCVARGVSPPCPQCAAGRESLCDSFIDGGGFPAGAMIGLNNFTSGSWAPCFVAHHSQLHAVADAIADEQAVVIDPVACSLHGVLRRRPRSDETVLVQGAGIIGLGVVMSLRALGFDGTVWALVRSARQAERMRGFGADHAMVVPRAASAAERYDRVAESVGGRRVAGPFGNQILLGGFDVVYDCVGSGPSLTDAMKFARPGGAVVALGTSGISLVETTPLWFCELELVGAFGRQMESVGGRRVHTYDLLTEWMQSGRITLDGLLTHTFAVGDYKRALSLLSRPSRDRSRVIKVAFDHRA